MDTVRIVTHQSDLVKSVNEDERLFTAVVLRPEATDGHGDIYSHDVVKSAAHDYVRHCMNTNLQHSIDLEKSDMEIVESYVAPVDIQLEEGTILKGDWVMTAKISSDILWDSVKSGEMTGFSVGVSGMVEELA